ncbi:histidyl-tRNA synthetase [Melanogaster broomeanus]|nr:histidyl-tRNA synthetase [Melanogaster broomeanus]
MLRRRNSGELKKTLAAMDKAEGSMGGAGGNESKDAKQKDRLLLKTAKGTRDYGPGEMFCREHIERIVKDVFTSYGASCLDTPVFERKDVLTDKYGEDQKLIFDLMDQGGEQLALRYDHTVPLARYLAMSGATVQGKIWQVGKVYRRDNPVMSKGRMREFMQADLDIVGSWDPMIPDAEMISLLCTILSKLDVGEFTVKINNRKILDGIFEVCGVPPKKIRMISSAVDKLDKAPWEDVKKEMTDEKGLSSEVADKIGEYVKLKGGPALLAQLKGDETLMSNASAKDGILEMELLFTLLGAYKIHDKISFDMSLARGLDYYTGIIYEATVAASAPPSFAANATTSTTSAPPPTPAPKKKAKKPKTEDADEDEEVDESQVGVGSIAAGGRYDNLVGSFHICCSGRGKERRSVIGLDRIFALVWPKWVERGMRSKDTMAFVIAVGDGLLEERIRLVQELREAGIKTDFLAKKKPKYQAQFAAAERDEVPFDILLGGEELKEGLVIVKSRSGNLSTGRRSGDEVKREELIDWLKQTPTYLNWSSGRLI